MKKLMIICAIFGGLALGAWMACRITGALNVYTVRSNGNMPTLQINDLLLASNLKEPQLFDFINIENQEYLVVYRLCGLPGDTLQLLDGILYRNNKPQQQSFETTQQYELSQHKFHQLMESGTLGKEPVYQAQDSLIIVDIIDAVAKKAGITSKHVKPKRARNSSIVEQWCNDYNEDNFGPVIVPADSYFVLGDNRHNANDSRYIGFIDKSRYRSTVLWR